MGPIRKSRICRAELGKPSFHPTLHKCTIRQKGQVVNVATIGCWFQPDFVPKLETVWCDLEGAISSIVIISCSARLFIRSIFYS